MVSIHAALQQVADNPDFTTDDLLEVKVHELVARTLFEIANSPNPKVRGSMRQATRAQKMIMDRLVGIRRPGSHPAAQDGISLEFIDLTQGALE